MHALSLVLASSSSPLPQFAHVDMMFCLFMYVNVGINKGIVCVLIVKGRRYYVCRKFCAYDVRTFSIETLGVTGGGCQ